MSEAKSNDVLRVLISGAAGQIGYSLIPMIAAGQVYGPTQRVHLVLFDIPPMEEKLQGVAMEIEDCGFELVQGVTCSVDADEAFKGINYAILLGGFPRRAGMERKDLLEKNSPIFIGQGKAFDAHAAPGAKALVVANPANTNCLVLATNAPSRPKTCFSALTRLDQQRASAQVAAKCGVAVDKVRNVVIWGNHSSTMVPDVTNAYILEDGDNKRRSVDLDGEWVEKTFTPLVQQRGAAVIKARGLSSAMSAANAAALHMRDWHLGTSEPVSMAVYSTGAYGVAEGLMYSFPVTIKDGEYTIVEGVKSNEFVTARMKDSEAELLQERAEALPAQQ